MAYHSNLKSQVIDRFFKLTLIHAYKCDLREFSEIKKVHLHYVKTKNGSELYFV